MKNIALSIIIACTSFALSLSAQDAKIPKFRFGMKGTAQLTWLKPDFRDLPEGFTAENGGVKGNLAWGPQVEFLLDKKGNFYLSTGFEINYSKGSVEGNYPTVDDLGVKRIFTYESAYTMRFLEVPLMIKFRTDEIGYMRYFGLFGMGAGFRLRAENALAITGDFSSPTTVTQFERNSNDVANPLKGSLLIGAGVEYALTGNTALVGSILFNNNFTNVLKNQDQTFNVRDNGILNYFQLNVGILF